MPQNCVCICLLVVQSCPTLCDPIDYSPPGSFVREILHARILEWIAIPFSRRSSRPRDGTWIHKSAHKLQAHLLQSKPPGQPNRQQSCTLKKQLRWYFFLKIYQIKAMEKKIKNQNSIQRLKVIFLIYILFQMFSLFQDQFDFLNIIFFWISFKFQQY